MENSWRILCCVLHRRRDVTYLLCMHPYSHSHYHRPRQHSHLLASASRNHSNVSIQPTSALIQAEKTMIDRVDIAGLTSRAGEASAPHLRSTGTSTIVAQSLDAEASVQRRLGASVVAELLDATCVISGACCRTADVVGVVIGRGAGLRACCLSESEGEELDGGEQERCL